MKGTIGIALIALSLVTATPASAQQLATPQAPQVSATSAAALPPLGNAASEHQVGVGIRFFPESSSGIGGGIRYFMGGNLGLQAEVAHFSIGHRFDDVSANQINAAAIYRISEHKFHAPLSLIPYAGAGVNIIRGNCGNIDCDFFDFDFDDFDGDPDEHSVGALIFGGAELFFKAVPKLSVSGEITFTSNNDAFGGGGRGTIAAHWYFK